MRASMLALFSTLMSACASPWEPAFDEQLRDEERGKVEIAPAAEALTFARRSTPQGPQLIAVTGWQDGRIAGLAVAAPGAGGDAIALLRERGYDALRDEVLAAAAAARVTVPADELLSPVDFDAAHIAVGTNYPEHASDAGTTRPFLFPKLVRPTGSGSSVHAGDGLLDYEVEIAVVPLEPLAGGTAPELLGLMVANDFTDRATLMRAVDRNDIESGKGFTTGKSFEGYLPVGSLLVVARNWRSFMAGLELRLFVNGRLRQRSRASEMVWNVDEMLAQIHKRKATAWEHRGAQVPLLPGDAIAARTLILTGTPHGTVFSGMPPRFIAGGLARWLLGGWDRSVPERVIEAYVDGARGAGAYLQPGDEVLIHVQRLGQIRSQVTR